jgi:hypothetical protein
VAKQCTYSTIFGGKLSLNMDLIRSDRKKTVELTISGKPGGNSREAGNLLDGSFVSVSVGDQYLLTSPSNSGCTFQLQRDRGISLANDLVSSGQF